jgi:NitT/TauT family transport system substrate-binding protein
MRTTYRRRISRSIAGTCAAVVCLSLLSACGKSGPDSSDEVTIAKTSQNGLQLILVDIADQEGFFSKHGVHVKVVALNGDAAAIPALISGSVQFAVSTSTPFFAAVMKSDKIEAVAPLSAEPPEQIVLNKAQADKLGINAKTPVEQRIQALKGKHVAVQDVGGGLQYTLNAALTSSGVGTGETEVSAISPYSAMLAALHRNAIDAAAPAVPYGSQAVAQGDAIMLADIWAGDVPSIQELYFELLNVNREYATGHPKTVQNIKDALADAMSFIRKNPDGALKVAKKLLPNFSDAVLKEALDGGNPYPTTTEITAKDFTKLADFAKASGVDPSGVTYDKSVWKG